MIKCYFSVDNENDDCPFQPCEMPVPRVDEMMYVEGESDVWRVTAVEYQFRRETSLHMVDKVIPIAVNVVLHKVEQPL